MQALIKAAIITGFFSLAGICYILFSVLNNPADDAVAEVAINPSAEAATAVSEPKPAPPPSENVVQPTPSNPAPSVTTMRRMSYALPGYSAIKQVSLSFPAIKRQVERQHQQQRRREEEEQRRLEEQERAFFSMEVEPPAAPSRTAPVPEQPAGQPSIDERQPQVSPRSTRPVTPEIERSILAEENKTKEENRKQQMLQSGSRLPVREMSKRFDGTLSNQQLNSILNDIFGEKGEQDSDATCVHIKHLPETDVTARQLASFLLKQGFTMAGRGEASPKDKGIKVDATGKCIVVTIGKIE